jgi:flavin reductase (DIM6/NTAB) family NADH-FMN oxidoreductase RutF
VVLVTTEDVDRKVQRGLTVSSFTTICLTPSPYVCFSTRQVSRAADLIAQRGFFIVHLLPSSAEFAKLAEAFSKSDLAPHSHTKNQNPFDLAQWKRDRNWSLPVFAGVLGALFCKVDKTVDVGDHRLWIAEVEDVAVDDSVDGTALGYCGRKYRKEGDPMFPHDASEE